MKQRFTTLIISLLALLPRMASAQELTVQSFSLSPAEIIQGNEQRKDLNGKACALVKVQVVDGIDRVEGNVIGGIDSRGTEKRIYLTDGTKVFRVYPHSHLPITITTSEYNIEKLEGNRVYILRLTGGGSTEVKPQKKVTKKETPKIEEPIIETPQSQANTYQEPPQPTYREYYNETPVAPKKTHYTSDAEFHVYAGIGFNAISAMGPSIHLGASYSKFHLEAGYVFGLDKVEDIHLSISSTLSEAYDYSCSKFWIRAGYSFGEEKFQISPQIGATFNMISGKSVSGTSNTTDYFKDSNPMSLFAAVRLSYEVAEHLRIHITPQYDFSLGGDQIYEVIKQGDSKIKAWGEGFGINAGVIYEF